MAFSIAYVIAYQMGMAPFRYYPAIQRFSTELLPASTSGPGMLWYGWMALATVAALAFALVVPRRLAERVPPSVTWLVPVVAVVLILVHERRWFL